MYACHNVTDEFTHTLIPEVARITSNGYRCGGRLNVTPGRRTTARCVQLITIIVLNM